MRRPTGNDDTLIRAAGRGDAAAFAELMRRHRAWVCRLLCAFTKDADAAEDLAQEVFTRLHRHAKGYTGRGAFVSYLQQIAANVGRTYRRQEARVTFLSWEDAVMARSGAPPPAGSDPLAQLLLRGLQAEVHAALHTLPSDQREAVFLRYFQGMTVPEIADRLNCPAGTVKSRLFHALRKIRAALTPLDNERKQF